MIDIEQEPEVKAFLNSIRSKNTRKYYKRSLAIFGEFYGKPFKTVLEERKDDLTPRANENLIDGKFRAQRFERVIEEFHSWMLDKGYKINTARGYTVGILQLLRYYQMALTIRAGSPISQTTISTEDFPLRPQHVRKMFHNARDLRSQLILSMANDLGWRIGDFISIKVGKLPNLDEDAPIEWLYMTEKEKVIAKSCLSVTTVELLKEYLFTYQLKAEDYLFKSNGSHIADETVNRRLKDLAEASEIPLNGKKLTFHCFRKMLISNAKNLKLDSDIIKMMVGKSVRKDMLTYMTTIDVREAFKTLQTRTRINGDLLSRKKQDEINVLKERIAVLEKTQQALAKTIKGLSEGELTIHKKLDNGKIITRKKKPKTQS